MSQLFEGFSRATVRQSQQDAAPRHMVPIELVLPEPAATGEAPGNAMPEDADSRGAVEINTAVKSEQTRSVMVQPPPSLAFSRVERPQQPGRREISRPGRPARRHSRATRTEIFASNQ